MSVEQKSPAHSVEVAERSPTQEDISEKEQVEQSPAGSLSKLTVHENLQDSRELPNSVRSDHEDTTVNPPVVAFMEISGQKEKTNSGPTVFSTTTYSSYDGYEDDHDDDDGTIRISGNFPKSNGKAEDIVPSHPLNFQYRFPQEVDPKFWKPDQFQDTFTSTPQLELNKEDDWHHPHRGYTFIPELTLKASQNWRTGENCYFSCIAIHLYGSHQYWARVKAHHIAFVENILLDKSHPRYDLYTAKNNANPKKSLWQRLSTPYEYQDQEIIQVTADLYDLFIVQYDVILEEGQTDREDTPVYCTKFQTRGNYNSRHIIIRYLTRSNHYQPLVPTKELGSEFTFPLLWRNTGSHGEIDAPDKIFPRYQCHITDLHIATAVGFNDISGMLNTQSSQAKVEAIEQK